MPLAPAARDRLLALALAALVLGACGTKQPANGDGDGGTGGTGASGASIVFDNPGPIVATSTATLTIGFSVKGDDAPVTLWLEGAYLDGSIDTSDVTTHGGHAQIVLQTPSEPSTFAVRARTSNGPEARLDVTVGSQGLATVTLVPTYAGKRPARPVVGSVFTKTSCDELSRASMASGLTDGSSATMVGIGERLNIDKVPAGARVSLLVRMAHYVSACVDLDRLAPGATEDLGEVDMIDRPISIAHSSLKASYSFEPVGADATTYTAVLDGAASRAAEAFLPAQSAEAGALLDAMAGEAPTTQQMAFTTNRSANGWDGTTATWLAQHPPLMRSRVLAWLTSAKAEAQAPLTATLLASTTPAHVTVTPVSWGAVDLSMMGGGVTAKSAFDWTGDTDDGVHMGGTLFVQPTALLARAADVYAKKDVALATGVPSALSLGIDCDGLASGLVGAGASFPACNATCTADLCRTALLKRWALAMGASAAANDLVQVAMNVSAHAQVDDSATLLTLDGTWVGKITSGTTTSGMQGKVSASK